MATQAESKKTREGILTLLREGKNIADACRIMGVSNSAFYKYQSADPDFALQAEKIRVAKKNGDLDFNKGKDVPDFPEFCEKYMHTKLWWHQLQWYDMLEGRPPRDLHKSMTYERAERTELTEDELEDFDPASDGNNLLMVNTPPGHAKSTTITFMYTVWRIVKNPDISCLIVSKSASMAEAFLGQIKKALTHPDYKLLQDTFAPAGGWNDGKVEWRQNQFTIGGKSGTAGKDPTCQALGIKSQVYGKRSDLIIIDDAVDGTNVADYNKQAMWILGEVLSRLNNVDGKVLIVGTRIAANDLYAELRKEELYNGNPQPWDYLLQPAVLEFAEERRDWVTLWPWSDKPSAPGQKPLANGYYRRWDGLKLFQQRAKTPTALWSAMYMQEQVDTHGIFSLSDINNCIDGRSPGIIPANKLAGRENGMEGLKVIAGMDPSVVKFAAAVCMGVDTRTGERWVIDTFTKAKMHPDEIRKLIYTWTDKYKVKEWIIEENAFQGFLTKDTEVKTYLMNHGSRLTPFITSGKNKHDPDFGVAAMSTLFELRKVRLPKINTEHMKALVQQLITWHPKAGNTDRKIKTDLVMALWMAEVTAATLVTRAAKNTGFQKANMFTTRGDIQRRFIRNYTGDIVPVLEN